LPLQTTPPVGGGFKTTADTGSQHSQRRSHHYQTTSGIYCCGCRSICYGLVVTPFQRKPLATNRITDCLYSAGPILRSFQHCSRGYPKYFKNVSHNAPNHARQRTRRERRGCNRSVPRAGSLSLGREVFSCEL